MGASSQVIRAVLDTNVILSALLFGGRLERLHRAWRAGRLRLVLSRETADELLRVMAYPKFRLTHAEITFLFDTELLPFADVIDLTAAKREQRWCRDPADDSFIRCAKAGKCVRLITGDDDLLSLKRVGKVAILSPAEFLGVLGEIE
ncbi:MAG: putative toxin-antitoxin system toxin component, PIN family [Deltaproteobacteria bacterium 21-66-5]|nr:MAG: putative toxin-antitoxin system toxin component, PIN family [Deltaproteobacteria bacterium 21-66-5]